MQLDVTYLLRKLIFFDSAISSLLEKHEVSALYLRNKPTLSEARKQRRMHFAPEIILQRAVQDMGREVEQHSPNNSGVSKQSIIDNS